MRIFPHLKFLETFGFDVAVSINQLFIPRNHQIQRVIDFAIEAEDYEPLEQMLSAVTNPFGENPRLKHLSEPPKPEEEIKQTFCGT